MKFNTKTTNRLPLISYSGGSRSIGLVHPQNNILKMSEVRSKHAVNYMCVLNCSETRSLFIETQCVCKTRLCLACCPQLPGYKSGWETN